MHHMNEQAFFESLSDETRRRLLALLMKQGELCVCELFYALDMPQPKVSRHLGVMREAGLLSQRREGTWVFYRLQPQLPLWAYKVLEAMVQGVELAGREDALRLEGMSNRPARCCA
jgi:ArsR family transcriptional regulator